MRGWLLFGGRSGWAVRHSVQSHQLLGVGVAGGNAGVAPPRQVVGFRRLQRVAVLPALNGVSRVLREARAEAAAGHGVKLIAGRLGGEGGGIRVRANKFTTCHKIVHWEKDTEC